MDFGGLTMGDTRTSRFADSALLSGLVTQNQIDQASASLSLGAAATSVEIDDEAFSAHLVEAGILTAYQAEQLRAGRTKLTLGPYVITDWLGQGGMGQVFKATHQMMGREVAIKVLPQGKSSPDAIASFTREIRTQAQLDDPHLVRAYDAGHDGNVYFLVTEYVPGTDLRRLVRSEGRLTMHQAASIVMQAALGLDHAHQLGLIHRDIKPGNILVTPEGQAKLSDLGLAGFLSDRDDDPRAGKIVGTADYLAPEQVRFPGEVSPVSDIYSLGCTLYYAVTAKVPFPGGRTRDKVRRHLEETPWHPRRFNPELSEEFVDVIADTMEKEPQRRVQTAAEVAARLEPWAGESCHVPTHGLNRSPWHAPPLPTGYHDTAEELSEAELSSNNSDSRVDSASQVSESTHPMSSAGQDTGVIRPHAAPQPPPLPRDKTRGSRQVTTALAIAIPISMLLGAAIGAAFMSLWAR